MDKVGYIYDEERELNIIDFEEAYQLLKKQVKKDNHILGCDCSKKDKEIERLSRTTVMYDEMLCEKNNEVDRLNNIIDELEKWLEENDRQLCLRKLKALKEGKNES